MSARRKGDRRAVVRRGSRFRRPIVEEIVVLLVEDDEPVARMIAHTMGPARARVVTVGAVDHARAHLDDSCEPCAAVIADMRLGSNAWGGAEVLEHARIVRPDALLMGMTGLARTAELEERIGRLNVPFHEKPVATAVLFAFLRDAAAKRGSERSRRVAIADTLGDLGGLTDAERETLFHLSYGLAVKEIAAVMGIEESTVRGYEQEIRRKLGHLRSVNAIYGRFIAEILRSS